ncbi:hypothetical protein LCGC14_3105950, partial [marine sediment metagenome]
MLVNKRRILFIGESSFLATGFAVYWNEVIKRLYETGDFSIAELGGYASDGDPQIQSVPWKFYPVQPHPSDQRAQQIFRSKPTNQFGEWRFDDVCIDWKPDLVVDHRDFWMCFDKDTPIILADGSVKNIKNITTKDKVLTHKGNDCSVIDHFQRKYSGKLYTIKASNLTIPITVTSDHPLLIVNRHKKHFLNENWNSNKAVWKLAGEITNDDFLCLPIPKNIKDDKKYPIGLCRLIGYYLAQGCMLYEGKRKNNKIKGIQLVFNHKLADYVEDAVKLIKTHFSLSATVHRRGNCSVIRAYGRNMGEFLLLHCGEHARNKRISKQLY